MFRQFLTRLLMGGKAFLWGAVPLALLGVGMLCLTSCSCQEADVQVTGMEITQGIQTAANTVPLVANRSTAARVFLNTSATQATGPVTGVLTVTVDGNEITPPGGLIQILPVDAQPNPDKNIENHTLNFELPAPSGITTSSDVDFAVTISYVRDTDQSNNTFRADNLSFIELDNPVLLFTLIDYTPSGSGLPALATVQAGSGDAMVRGIYPVLESDPGLYEPAVPPAIVFSVDLNGNNLIDTLSESSTLLSTLSLIRDLQVVLGLSPLSYTFIYGWLNGSPMNGFAGLGPVGGFSAFGNTTLNRFQRSYAHELGHNFGLNHNNNTIAPDAGWDTGARLENNPAANNTTGRVKPGTFVDIMNSGPPTNSTWVDATNYILFFNRMLIETVLPSPAASQRRSVSSGNPAKPPIDAPGVMIVHGYFNAKGTQLLYLHPTLRLTNPAKVPSNKDNGKFTAVITSTNGKKRSFPFDAEVCYEGIDKLQHGFFELLISMDPSLKVEKLEIFKTESRQKMGGWTASRPPSVKILSPGQGSRLGEQTTVRWTADDPDTNPGDMRFHLQYSPDGGSNWVAVGVNLTGNSYTFNSREIPPANDGLGILRIYACDGLNTITDQVGGLTL